MSPGILGEIETRAMFATLPPCAVCQQNQLKKMLASAKQSCNDARLDRSERQVDRHVWTDQGRSASRWGHRARNGSFSFSSGRPVRCLFGLALGCAMPKRRAGRPTNFNWACTSSSSSTVVGRWSLKDNSVVGGWTPKDTFF